MNRIIKISIIFLLLIFQSCKEEDDILPGNCEGNCTEVVGKIMTDNGNIPISNLRLTIKWDNAKDWGSSITSIRRKKAETITDANGNFKLFFFVHDDEINNGSFRINYEIDESKYCSPSPNSIIQFQLGRRDTVISVNYNIPKKSFLNLKLLNLDKMEDSDELTTGFIYEKPQGIIQPMDEYYYVWSRESNKENLIEIAGNQKIIVEINRKTKNITKREIDTIFLKAGTKLNYTIDFKN